MLKKALYILPVLILVVAGGIFLAQRDGTDPGAQSNQSATQNGSTASGQTDDLARPANYVDYDKEKLAEAGEDTSIVLFFKAEWCSSCSALDRDIKQNGDQIPEDVLIMTVDFDTATDLKKKYNVRQQHTLVQVDSQGEEVKTWVLSPTLADILDKAELG